MVQSIKERFTDLEKHPATAYTGNTKLLLKGLGSGEKSEQGQNWLLDQAAYSITKPAPAGKGKYPRRKTIVGDVDYQWQADLTDMSAYHEYNEGYRYILMVIDIFSRYGFAEPLKTKEGKEVSEALSHIMKRSGRKPFKLQVDLGKEFYNQHFKAMLKRAGINMFSSQEPEIKAALVERWNRTLKDRFTRYIIANKDHNWVKVLQPMVDAYNRTRHSSLGMSPVDVMGLSGLERNELWNKQYPHLTMKQYRRNMKDDRHLKVGDLVLISIQKRRFTKGFMPRYKREVFRIKKKCYGSNRIFFRLEDLKGEELEGSWLSDQLLKVNKKSGGPPKEIERVVSRRPPKGQKGKVKVSYMGWDEKFDEWLPKASVPSYVM